ncbi:MAG: hypothetical protein R3284_12575, partial [Rubricoccaceae bacterium]|nr:hypothetical protein [Rubricoccaceae bacterium]
MARTLLTAIIISFAVAGCDSDPSQPPLPDIIHSDTREDMEMFRGQWEAEGPGSYVLTNYRRCVCLENLTIYTITVVDGMPVSATRQPFEEEPSDVPVSKVP